MKGKLAENQFKNWKKEEIKELAKEMGVSEEGTIKEIIERICEVEVEVPGENELTPEEVMEIKKAEAEAEAKEEALQAEKEAEGKKGVRCVERFRDIVENRVREIGEEWNVEEKRAAYLIERGLVEEL